MEKIWSSFLTDRDKKVFEASGYGSVAGFGKRPALLVIDASYAFVGDRREPILESIKRWHNSSGEEAWDAVDSIGRLATVFRAKKMPVIYTSHQYRDDHWDYGAWHWKNRRTGDEELASASDKDPHAIVEQIAPQAQDIVIHKQKPSAFFGTNLLSYLQYLGCDTVILTGGTTSGCIRATAIDAFSYNFRVAIVAEGCFDRSQASHAINLCDMNAKYGDVVSEQTVQDYAKGLGTDLFENLPGGR